MTATFTEIRADELHVYVRGRLVMKRWLRTGVSATFHVAPAGVRWSGATHQSGEDTDE